MDVYGYIGVCKGIHGYINNKGIHGYIGVCKGI